MTPLMLLVGLGGGGVSLTCGELDRINGLSELLLKFRGGSLKTLQGFAKAASQFRQLFGAEHQQCDDGNHRHLWKTNPKNVHWL